MQACYKNQKKKRMKIDVCKNQKRFTVCYGIFQMNLWFLYSNINYNRMIWLKNGLRAIWNYLILTVCIGRRQRKMPLQGHPWIQRWPAWWWPIRMFLDWNLCSWFAGFLHWNFDIRPVRRAQVCAMLSSDCSSLSNSFCWRKLSNYTIDQCKKKMFA